MEKKKKNNLLKKIGFYRTLEVLSPDAKPITITEFFLKFNTNGYYNQFIRIKEELLTKDIIKIQKSTDTGDKMIFLTTNGALMKVRIKEIMHQLEK